MEDVTAIIPSYGRPELTRGAVERLREQTMRPAEVVVVDDGAEVPYTGGNGERVVRHGVNRGFAAAVNTGVRGCQTRLVAVLNNDVTLAADWLERLVGVISGQGVEFACGKLMRPDGRIDGTFDLLSRGGLAWRAGSGRADGALWTRGRRILFTSFTAVVAKREGLELDETYGSYYEDVEWSLRTAIGNKPGYFEPAAGGVHTGSATAGAWSAYMTRQILRNHRRVARQYLLPEYGDAYRVARMLLGGQCLAHGRWPGVEEEAVAKKARGERLAGVLRESEALLYELQRESGMDRLWQWYFRLAGRME
jgi:GT2 family glycosyltransferase